MATVVFATRETKSMRQLCSTSTLAKAAVDFPLSNLWSVTVNRLFRVLTTSFIDNLKEATLTHWFTYILANNNQ